MNIGNITSNNFNLDNNGKDIQIEVYEQLIEQLQQENKELKEKYVNAVADYETTMFEKEQLKKQLEEKNKPQIFIDTQNIEERYAEGLYQDYLEEENKQLKIQISAREEVCNRLESNWNKLKEWASNFYNSEEVGWAGCGMRYTLEKMKEIERSEINGKK